MRVDNTQKQNIENTENIQLMPEDNELLSAVNAQFSEVLSEQIANIQPDEISQSSLFDADYNYDSVSMSLQDALFFINLTREGQFSIETNKTSDFQNIMQTEIAQNVVSKRTVEITNQLTSLIEKAQKTQKPVRISFDNDVSVILKIDKHGKVSAEFIPGSLEVENYLKNNIPVLRQKFDEQNLPYNDLIYRQNNKQERNRNKNKGER